MLRMELEESDRDLLERLVQALKLKHVYLRAIAKGQGERRDELNKVYGILTKVMEDVAASGNIVLQLQAEIFNSVIDSLDETRSEEDRKDWAESVEEMRCMERKFYSDQLKKGNG